MNNTEENIIKPKRGRKSKKELLETLNIEPMATHIEVKEEVIEEVTEKIAKKRGRKPKGGKIIQQIITNKPQENEKQNVILHLKCSLKDLQLQNNADNNLLVSSYNIFSNNNELNYNMIMNDQDQQQLTTNDENDDDINDKDINKDIHKKLKQLEHNLHINNINNKRSACFLDTYEFDNPAVYIPKHYINGVYEVYGCFCSPECAVAHLNKESIDSSTKFERYHLLNNLYAGVYNYTKNIKPAPDPYYMLDKYLGNLSIQEYRSLLRNERLFLIVDKPLTRILPELHENNNDFMLNNKIIPSNNNNQKFKGNKRKNNKSTIVNENFGVTNVE